MGAEPSGLPRDTRNRSRHRDAGIVAAAIAKPEDAEQVQAHIAKALRLDQKALYRRVERLVKELREALLTGGIDGEAALEIFDSAAVSIDWGSGTEGTVEPGPSTPKGAQRWR